MKVRTFIAVGLLSLSAGTAAAAWSHGQSAREPTVFLGSFYHQHFTEEHQYRFQIDL